MLCWSRSHSLKATMMVSAGTLSGDVSGFCPHPVFAEGRALKSALAKSILQIAPDNPEGLGKGQSWHGRFFPAGCVFIYISPAITIHLVSLQHNTLAEAVRYFGHRLLPF
jgi:hypothetical protein